MKINKSVKFKFKSIDAFNSWKKCWTDEVQYVFPEEFEFLSDLKIHTGFMHYDDSIWEIYDSIGNVVTTARVAISSDELDYVELVRDDTTNETDSDIQERIEFAMKKIEEGREILKRIADYKKLTYGQFLMIQKEID